MMPKITKSSYWDETINAEVAVPDSMQVIDGDDEPSIDTGILNQHGRPIMRERKRIQVGFVARKQ